MEMAVSRSSARELRGAETGGGYAGKAQPLQRPQAMRSGIGASSRRVSGERLLYFGGLKGVNPVGIAAPTRTGR